jgi:hypothetical protein
VLRARKVRKIASRPGDHNKATVVVVVVTRLVLVMHIGAGCEKTGGTAKAAIACSHHECSGYYARTLPIERRKKAE